MTRCSNPADAVADAVGVPVASELVVAARVVFLFMLLLLKAFLALSVAAYPYSVAAYVYAVAAKAVAA